MDYVKLFEILSAILSFIGIPILSIPRRSGMWVLILATFFGIIFAYLAEHKFLLFQNFYIFAFDIYALWSWKKKGIKF